MNTSGLLQSYLKMELVAEETVWNQGICLFQKNDCVIKVTLKAFSINYHTHRTTGSIDDRLLKWWQIRDFMSHEG